MKFRSNIIVWIIGSLVVLAVLNLYFGGGLNQSVEKITYSEFWSKVSSGEVTSVQIQDGTVSGVYNNNVKFTTNIPVNDDKIFDLMRQNKVDVAIKPVERSSFGNLLISWLPLLLLLGVFIFFMRQAKGGAGGAMSFGRSRAKLNTKNDKVTFANVAGIEEAKEELLEIVEYLKSPAKFKQLGAKIPKGALLVGSPGTGKTLLARAVAGEASVPFFSISGSDFVEMFVGVGAARVRDMFEQAKKNAPCLLFIDEIDAVGRHRGAGLGGGNDEREQTLNQLLVEMDGFESNEGIIILAATNRPDVLDPALLRPGRFDRQVVVPSPDVVGRTAILKVHAAKVPVAPDVDLEVIARGTPGFSGADLANLVNESALIAARKNKKHVFMDDFEVAKDKVMMGAERRSMAMTDTEKALTAFHEAGHALVGLKVPQYDKLHKVTIIPRGRALGVTMSLPEKDHFNYNQTQLTSRLAVLFGGRIAEEIVYGKENVTTGASSDIQQATQVARRMITEFGFSDKLGRIRYSANEQEVFLGHSVAQQKNISDATAALIDDEVKRLISDAESTARDIIIRNRQELDMIANSLLEFETLSGDEVEKLLKGENLAEIRDTKAKNNKETEAAVLSTVPNVEVKSPFST